MTDVLRWGILGTGNIASQFATGLQALPDARLVAVGSRSQATADAFGDRFNAPHRHASYAGVAADPEVDAVYIATPHHLHIENMLLCLEAGKAVLCEKPFTINAAQARAAIALARRKGVFLMEAMWTRFMPLMVELRRLLAEQAIGEVRMVTADFGFRTKFNPASRLFDPNMGGGALLDVGVYPVSLAFMVLGRPNQVVSLAELGKTGVDEQGAMVFGYPRGQLAVLHTAIGTRSPNEAIIMGAEGWIRIHPRWWYPTTMTIDRPGQPPEQREVPYEGNGYNYEADEVHRCLRAGKLESDIMPLDETLAIMETLDAIRAQWGLRYPME
ncbi:MAG TPA: Gfo/Idh/MocA family oxidoreductase [Caldilineaceae bacterium]|nr:Gfo/Idh/MocA family oxidoreductase [Caldilineaceae bacterium]